jgi:DNA-binding transcriptional ArsR family regulator
VAVVPVGEGDAEGGAAQAEADPDAQAWPSISTSSWVLAGSQAVLQTGWGFTGNHTYTNYGLVAGIGASVSRANVVFQEVTYDPDPSCLAANALQGANVSLAAPIELFGACQAGGGLLGLPAGVLFTARAVETLNGVQAVRFDASALDGTLSAWFAPSVPYPVRLEVHLPPLPTREQADADAQDDAAGSGSHLRGSHASASTAAAGAPIARNATLDLVGFTAGDAPLAAMDRPSDAAPALAFAARTPWGIDDTGVQHPFPLSAAYKAAKEDLAFADLRTFLAAHPSAYAAAAEYRQSTGGPGDQERTWGITVADGEEALAFEVAQRSPDPLLPVALRGQLPMTVTVRHGWGGVHPPAGLPASGVPAQYPTAASLLARWAAFDGSGTPGSAWSFHLECVEMAGESCRSAQVVAAAGLQRADMTFLYSPFALPGNPFGTETWAIVDRFVEFTQDGHATRMRVHDDRVDTASVGSGPLPPMPSASGEGGFHVRSAAVSGLPPTRWLPAPEQAASVGFLGLLLGAVYWVWPKMKALAFLGLFSRVERGDLLDHPARQRLVQLVEAEPGVHFHVLAQRAGLANGTATHHLRKLEQGGHVTVRRSGRYACYFPGGRVEAREAAAAPILKSGGARQVLATVRARPGLSNLELANATGLTPSTVNYHAQRLATAGLVEALRDGRNVRFHPLAPLRSEGANAAA